MAKVQRYRTFRYKVAAFPASKVKKTLQQRLRESYAVAPKPAMRTQVAGADPTDSENIVIFYRTEHQGLSCGILQSFKKGAPALATIMEQDADNYQLKKFIIPNDPKKKEQAEFTQSLMFFGIRGNHLVISEGRGFGSEVLESHLTWLLINHQSKPGPGSEDQYVMLDDNIPPKYAGRQISKIKEVKLFSEPNVIVGPSGDGQKKRRKEEAAPEEQTWTLQDDPLVDAAIDLLKRKNPRITREKLFTLEDAFQKGALRAELTLKYTAPRKAETSPLDELARTLRHQDVPYKITLPQGEPLTSDQTKISRKYSVLVVDDVPDSESIFSRMAAMLDELVQGRDIVPDP